MKKIQNRVAAAYREAKKKYAEPERGHSLHSPTFLTWHELYDAPGATIVYEREYRDLQQAGCKDVEQEMRRMLVHVLEQQERTTV